MNPNYILVFKFAPPKFTSHGATSMVYLKGILTKAATPLESINHSP